MLYRDDEDKRILEFSKMLTDKKYSYVFSRMLNLTYAVNSSTSELRELYYVALASMQRNLQIKNPPRPRVLGFGAQLADGLVKSLTAVGEGLGNLVGSTIGGLFGSLTKGLSFGSIIKVAALVGVGVLAAPVIVNTVRDIKKGEQNEKSSTTGKK